MSLPSVVSLLTYCCWTCWERLTFRLTADEQKHNTAFKSNHTTTYHLSFNVMPAAASLAIDRENRYLTTTTTGDWREAECVKKKKVKIWKNGNKWQMWQQGVIVRGTQLAVDFTAATHRHALRCVHYGWCEQATHGDKQDGADLLCLHETEIWFYLFMYLCIFLLLSSPNHWDSMKIKHFAEMLLNHWKHWTTAISPSSGWTRLFSLT